MTPHGPMDITFKSPTEAAIYWQARAEDADAKLTEAEAELYRRAQGWQQAEDRAYAAERALWECFLLSGADPSPYAAETRTDAGRDAGREQWRRTEDPYATVIEAVRELRTDYDDEERDNGAARKAIAAAQAEATAQHARAEAAEARLAEARTSTAWLRKVHREDMADAAEVAEARRGELEALLADRTFPTEEREALLSVTDEIERVLSTLSRGHQEKYGTVIRSARERLKRMGDEQ